MRSAKKTRIGKGVVARRVTVAALAQLAWVIGRWLEGQPRGYAVMPADAGERLWSAVSRDGAVIVEKNFSTGKSTEDWREKAAELARELFGDRLLSAPMVAGVHEEHAKLESTTNAWNYSLRASGLLPHTDGYIYGDNMPDYLLLLLESASVHGGESFLVDGERVRGRLSAEDARNAEEWTFDLTETAPPGHTDGRNATGPIFRRVKQGLWWRRQVSVHASKRLADAGHVRDLDAPLDEYQSIWLPLEASQIDLLRAVDRAVQIETRLAPRFALQPGQALLVDNFRMLHAREPFQLSDAHPRRLWRIWVWTDRAAGLPDIQIATTTDAAKIL